MIESMARELRIDSLELRRRNFIPPDRFPYQSLHHVFDAGATRTRSTRRFRFANGLTHVCAEYLGVHPDQITVITGDTSSWPYTGYGTGASRSAAVGGAAVMKAAIGLSEKVRRIAAHMLEAAPEDMVVEDGAAWVVGAPARRVSFKDVGRAAYLRAIELPEDEDPGLEAIGVFDPPAMAWPVRRQLCCRRG